MITTFDPGCRIIVRDEEWLVRRVDSSSDGGRENFDHKADLNKTL